MKYEFRRVVDPSEKLLNSYGTEGYHIIGTATEYGRDVAGRPEQKPIVYLQREVSDGAGVPFSKELALREGIRDGIVTWLYERSDASLRKIFGPES